jgi:hypothetical protein
MTIIFFTAQHLLPFDSASKRERLLQKDLLSRRFPGRYKRGADLKNASSRTICDRIPYPRITAVNPISRLNRVKGSILKRIRVLSRLLSTWILISTPWNRKVPKKTTAHPKAGGRFYAGLVMLISLPVWGTFNLLLHGDYIQPI